MHRLRCSPDRLGQPRLRSPDKVLVRMVNAGSRMHVPSIVRAQTRTRDILPRTASTALLIAEDGNPVSRRCRTCRPKSSWRRVKHSTSLINAPASGGTALPVYDRELSLSGNKINRDAGMLAYIGVNGAGHPSCLGSRSGNGPCLIPTRGCLPGRRLRFPIRPRA